MIKAYIFKSVSAHPQNIVSEDIKPNEVFYIDSPTLPQIVYLLETTTADGIRLL